MSVQLLLLVVLSVFALVAIGLLLQNVINDNPKAQGTPYRKIPQLMSPAERRFFDALHEVDADRHWLFTKIRLADLVATRKGLDPSARQTAFNKIKAKHIDFVLCKPVTMEPVLAVELDDASHRAKSRQKRDAFVDEVACAVGLPLLHIKAASGYDRTELRNRIYSMLRSTEEPTIAEQPHPRGDETPAISAVEWLRGEQDEQPARKA